MSKLPGRRNGVPFSWRNVPVERAAEVMFEEHGAEAQKQARLGKAAGRRARNRKIYAYWESVEKILTERAAREAAQVQETERQT